MIRLIAILTSIGLLTLAGLIAASPNVAFEIAHFRPLKSLDVDKLETHKSRLEGTTSFFAERNEIEVRVPEDMTVGDLLTLYSIDLPEIRQQIARQEGVKELPDSHVLSAGSSFTFFLTPQEMRNR